ncbi:MAG TPA: hypothetical protein VFU05_16910 [Cyclobacteriaceae bacterium]|nr:hypothetical protein [Cyclobacteriaceae bacterium]
MRKTVKRILASSILIGLVTTSGLVTIIFFPEPLFANKLEHGQFNVYSNDKIDNDIKQILDNAVSLVRDSELYDKSYHFDIFLSYNSSFNKLDDRILGYGPSARATDNNITIKVAVDIKKNLFFPTFYQKCEGNLTDLLAHEMVHCLQDNKYGKLKFNPFRHPELWKLEGYPEYVARRTKLQSIDYSLANEIERYIELEGKSTDIWIAIEKDGCKAPKYYYKSRLLTEYLMDVKHFTYDKILNDTVSEDRIYEEMIKWKDSTKGQKIRAEKGPASNKRLCNRVDVLASWNFKHIVNPDRIKNKRL